MPVHIPVYNESPFRMPILVRSKSKLCDCDILDMNPEVAYINGERRHRDMNCNRIIPYSNVVEYDKFYGNNGFDEVVDCE